MCISVTPFGQDQIYSHIVRLDMVDQWVMSSNDKDHSKADILKAIICSHKQSYCFTLYQEWYPTNTSYSCSLKEKTHPPSLNHTKAANILQTEIYNVVNPWNPGIIC